MVGQLHGVGSRAGQVWGLGKRVVPARAARRKVWRSTTLRRRKGVAVWWGSGVCRRVGWHSRNGNGARGAGAGTQRMPRCGGVAPCRVWAAW